MPYYTGMAYPTDGFASKADCLRTFFKKLLCLSRLTFFHGREPAMSESEKMIWGSFFFVLLKTFFEKAYQLWIFRLIKPSVSSPQE